MDQYLQIGSSFCVLLCLIEKNSYLVILIHALSETKILQIIYFPLQSDLFTFTVSSKSWEQKLIKDMIFVLQGIEGQWIKFDTTKNVFKVDSGVSTMVITRFFFPIKLFSLLLSCRDILFFRQRTVKAMHLKAVVKI